MNGAVMPARRRFSRPNWLNIWLAIPALALVLLLFALPMIRLLMLSFEAGNIQYYGRALTDPLYLEVIWRTFRLAGVVTLAVFLLGYPVAHFLATAPRAWALAGLISVVLPFWTSLLVRTYAWMVLLGNNGVINRLLQGLHLTDRPLALMHNELGVTIGMIHVLLPYFVLPVYGTMLRVDRNLLAAAQGLGASRWNVLRLIYFPLTLPGVTAGAALVFILSLGFFITPALLGGGRVMTLPLLIEQQIDQTLNWGFGATLCMILLVITLGSYALLKYRSPQANSHA
jgi:putative spermidine/putrescine transport system permease protein